MLALAFLSGGHSVSNTINVVNKSITSLITTTLQQSSSQATAIQSLNVDCTEFATTTATRLYGGNVQGSDPTVTLKGCFKIFENRPKEDIEKICGSFMECGGDNITISGAIDLNMSSDTKNKVKQQINTGITNNIKSIMQQQIGLLQFGDKENNTINVFSSVVTNIVNNFIQNDLATIKQTQNIKIKNVYVHVVKLDDVINLIQKNIINNKTYQNAVNKISNDIYAYTKQSYVMQGPLNLLFSIAGILIGGFVILGLILWIIKQQNKKPDV
jgi:hypothetical protein